MSDNNLYTAICFFLNGAEPLKYRNIKGLQKFENFARSKGVSYINYYRKNTREYSHRVYLNN